MSAENDSIIEEEVNVLEAIYIHELEVQRNDRNEVTDMVLQLHPATGDNLDLQYVCMTLVLGIPAEVIMALVLGIPAEYPNELPSIQIKNPRGIGEEELHSTLEAMLALSEERRGEAMLYELIELAKETLTEGNIPRCACMICLEHFVEGDNFQKTSCYHYFHDVCLGRYVKHVLIQEPEVKVAHAKPEPKKKLSLDDGLPKYFKVVCPVCREEINYSEDSFPETPVEEKFIYFPTEEMKQYQARMAVMLDKQRQCGGLIDLEAEKNKFLLKPEDMIFLNPSRRLSNTSPNISSDNLEEQGSDKEESDINSQGGRAGTKTVNPSNKGSKRNIKGASQSSNKLRGYVGVKTERNVKRPEFGGRSRKNYDYDDFGDTSYSGRDREYSQSNKRYKAKEYDEYGDDYEDDYAFMETHNQHDTNKAKTAKYKVDYKKDRKAEPESVNENCGEKPIYLDERKSSSNEFNYYNAKKSSNYHNNRRNNGHKFSDDYHGSNSSKYNRNRQIHNDSKELESKQGKTSICRSKSGNKNSFSDKERKSYDDRGVEDGHVDHGRLSTADCDNMSDNINDSPRKSHLDSNETDLRDRKSDKPKTERRVQSQVQSKYSPRNKGERNNNKQVEDRSQSDRPQSGRSFGRGRARQPNRDVDNSEADDFRGRDNRNYKSRDTENEKSKSLISKQSTDRIETDKIRINEKHSVPKTNEEPTNIPSTNDKSSSKQEHRFSKRQSRQTETPKDRSGDYQRKTLNGELNSDREDKYNNPSNIEDGAEYNFGNRNEFRGRGRGRGFNRKKNTEERTCSKQTQEHSEYKNHSIDKVIDKIKDIHVDSTTETKLQGSSCTTKEVSKRTSSDSKLSAPPGFCVKPPPGF